MEAIPAAKDTLHSSKSTKVMWPSSELLGSTIQEISVTAL